MKLEVLSIDEPNILAITEPVEIVLECTQLIVFALVVGQDGDGVVYLHGVRVG